MMRTIRRPKTWRVLTYGILAVAAVWLRWTFVEFRSGDFNAFLSQWWTYIEQHGHLAALRDGSFSNYDTPYLVLMALATYLPFRAIVAIKAISVAFDLVLAFLASRMAAVLRPGRPWLAVLAFGIVVFLPTVVMNSGVWGQCDSIYASFCLASLLALLKGRPWSSSIWLGIAFAFKLQAVFLLPVLVGVVLVNRLRLLSLVGAPLSYLACLVPALVAGRSLASQLMVYPNQISDPSGVGGAVGTAVGSGPGRPPGRPGGMPGGPPGAGGTGPAMQATTLTHNAPTPYAWLPGSDVFLYGGLVVVALIVLVFGVWLLVRRRPLSSGEIILVAATATLLVPVLLPNMHERYYYLAEVLAVVACLVDRRYAIPALGIQLASVSTYLGYLKDAPLMPLGVAAVVAVASAVIATAILVIRLRSSSSADPESVRHGEDAALLDAQGA